MANLVPVRAIGFRKVSVGDVAVVTSRVENRAVRGLKIEILFHVIRVLRAKATYQKMVGQRKLVLVHVVWPAEIEPIAIVRAQTFVAIAHSLTVD